MYASLLISLLAAFTAMLGKQWLNRYMRNEGGSTIERCGDRQRKFDGLKKWPFHLFVESLPVMLQIALLLLACGLCQHMVPINNFVAGILIALTVLGVLFYLGIVIVGTSSYECPLQTPASATLRSLWKNNGHRVASVLYSTNSVILRFKLAVRNSTQWARRGPHLPPLPVALCEIQEMSIPAPWSTEPWMESTSLVTLREINANDIRCVSWVLWNITDPEALDAAIRLAGTIRWFEDGLNVEPPCDLVVSTLKACFDSTGRIYSGSRDRAYYSAQAVLWIHIRAMCVSEEFALRFPLPSIHCDTTSFNPDLNHLLKIYSSRDTSGIISQMYGIHPKCSPTHLQWASNGLLHLSWAKRGVSDTFKPMFEYHSSRGWDTVPLNTVLNHLLASCIFLGWPIQEEALKIHDKL